MMLQTFTFSLVVASHPSLARLVPASSVLRLVCGGLSTVETLVHIHTSPVQHAHYSSCCQLAAPSPSPLQSPARARYRRPLVSYCS